MDNTLIQEKLLPRLTFNPGLELTGFQTTRPWSLMKPLDLVWGLEGVIGLLGKRSYSHHSVSLYPGKV